MPREELDKTSREELDKTSKEEPNETRTDIGRSRQVDSGGNQDQATDQEELNPQGDDAIGLQVPSARSPSAQAPSAEAPLASPSLYEPPQPAQQSLPAATASTPSSANAPTSPSLPPAQYLHPGLPKTDETSTKAEQKKREQLMVNTPLGAYITSIGQPKASLDLPFTAQGVPARRTAISNPREDLSQSTNKLQSLVVTWKKEHPSQRVYTTFFTDHRYRQQYQNPPPTPPFRPPLELNLHPRVF